MRCDRMKEDVREDDMFVDMKLNLCVYSVTIRFKSKSYDKIELSLMIYI